MVLLEERLKAGSTQKEVGEYEARIAVLLTVVALVAVMMAM